MLIRFHVAHSFPDTVMWQWKAADLSFHDAEWEEKAIWQGMHATVCVSCGYHFYYAAHNSTTCWAWTSKLSNNKFYLSVHTHTFTFLHQFHSQFNSVLLIHCFACSSQPQFFSSSSSLFLLSLNFMLLSLNFFFLFCTQHTFFSIYVYNFEEFCL